MDDQHDDQYDNRHDDQPADGEFETRLAELEALVEKLEGGEMPLDTSMTEFRRGVELARQCRALLERARQTVDMLQDPDDETSARPLDDH